MLGKLILGLFGIALTAGIVIAAVVGSVLLNGWAVSTSWNLLMPVLFGVPPLNMIQAISICLVLQVIRGYRHSNVPKEKAMEYLAGVLAHPLLAVLMAYIVSRYI